MAPEVLFTVIYGDRNPPRAFKDLHTFAEATLKDYVRHRVEDEDYPAITAEEGGSVLGTFVTGLTDANMEKLDYFEGSEYDRVTVKVKIGSTDEEREAQTYVFNEPSRLGHGEWDFEQFRREKMQFWSRGSYNSFAE